MMLMSILQKNALSKNLLANVTSLDAAKRNILVDVLANHMIVEYGR